MYDSIAKATKTLMFKEAFYGLFLISMNKEISKKIPTACVSKNQINPQLTINPDYWGSLKEPVQVGVLKHELLHIAFFHLTLMEQFPDKQLFNIAADLEVNQYIAKENCGEGWIYLNNYPELNLPSKVGVRFYYDALNKINQQRKNGNNDGKESGSKSNGSDPTKSKIWEYYDQMKEGQSTVCSHELWKEFYDGVSEADRKLIDKQIDYQLKKIAEDLKNRGNVPQELKEHIDTLFEIKEAVINWKEYLRRFGGSSNKTYTKKSRRKLNKRFVENPALKIKQKKHILVFRDTSGSTSEKDHIEFFNELHHIWKNGVKITLADCDAQVHQSDLYEYKGKPPKEMSGRGGTDFTPAIEFYNNNSRKYNALIYLTDGQCPGPAVKPKTNMLWVISSSGTLSYSHDYPGKVVQINR